MSNYPLLGTRAGENLLHKGTEFSFLMPLLPDEQNSTHQRVNLKDDHNSVMTSVECLNFLCTSESPAFIGIKVVIKQNESFSYVR